MLRILTPPPSMMSGSDRFGPRTLEELRRRGLACGQSNLWPEPINAWMNRYLPYALRRRLLRRTIAPRALKALTASLKPEDTVWILDAAQPHDTAAAFEQDVRKRCTGYLFHLQDNWLDAPDPRYRAMAATRLHLADRITVPNETLRARALAEVPEADVAAIEEPVDVERFTPLPGSNPRTLAWAGNIANLRELHALGDILNEVHRTESFDLLIMSGQRPHRRFPFRFPWRFQPYDHQTEAALLPQASIGLAPLENTPYNRCKGAYKVKVYMAAGLACIAAPVGMQAELVQTGATGYLASTRSAWVEALITALRDPDGTTRIGRTARTQAVKRFSHDAVMDAWREALTRPLRRQHPLGAAPR